MKIYISASWKNSIAVRHLAKALRECGHEVFDFTDPSCRKTYEAPPEMFPVPFDPEISQYKDYLNREEWRTAVNENRAAITWSDLIILLLPCGIDATADWALGLGMGKRTIIVGHPPKGERSEVHLWADAMFENVDEIIPWLNHNANLRL